MTGVLQESILIRIEPMTVRIVQLALRTQNMLKEDVIHAKLVAMFLRKGRLLVRYVPLEALQGQIFKMVLQSAFFVLITPSQVQSDKQSVNGVRLVL